MPDLSINFCGVRSPNPFWLASGPPTNTAYQVMRAFDAGWGGAVWKTIGVPGNFRRQEAISRQYGHCVTDG
jgi:dihydropyrimidine dehydrogenase (NAD+) subunit PreA